jgi:hypothetical protein
MRFTGTGVNMFNVNGATFSIDGDNNRVGVGIESPEQRLHVEGSTLLESQQTTGSPSLLSFRSGSVQSLDIKAINDAFGDIPANTYQFRMGGSPAPNVIFSRFDTPVLSIVNGPSDARVGIGTSEPDFAFEARGTIAFPELAATPVIGPYGSIGINDNTGQLGVYPPPLPLVFVRKSSLVQDNIGPVYTRANIHASNTSLINTLGVVHNNLYLQIPLAGFYRIDYSVTGRMDGTNGSAARAVLSVSVRVNGTIVSENMIIYSSQTSTNEPGKIPVVLELMSNDQVEFLYNVTHPTLGSPRFLISQGVGSNYSQQIIITKL